MGQAATAECKEQAMRPDRWDDVGEQNLVEVSRLCWQLGIIPRYDFPSLPDSAFCRSSPALPFAAPAASPAASDALVL